MPSTSELQTPAVIVKESQLDKNIIFMSDLAGKLGLNIRPMIKTHPNFAADILYRNR